MPVYFMRAGLSGPVKIGRADDVPARMYALQTGHYETLNVVRTVEGGEAEETSFHRQFKHRHIRGEWFHWDENMLLAEAKPLHLPVVSKAFNVLQEKNTDNETAALPQKACNFLALELKRRMDAQGFKQKALAIEASLNATYVRDILIGKSKNPAASKLARIASVLGCTADELLGRTTRKEATHV